MARTLPPDFEKAFIAKLKGSADIAALGGYVSWELSGPERPAIVVSRSPGAAVAGRYVDSVLIDIDCWHTARSLALTAARTVQAVLIAWPRGWTAGSTYISGVSLYSEPFHMTDPDTGQARYVATYHAVAH